MLWLGAAHQLAIVRTTVRIPGCKFASMDVLVACCSASMSLPLPAPARFSLRTGLPLRSRPRPRTRTVWAAMGHQHKGHRLRHQFPHELGRQQRAGGHGLPAKDCSGPDKQARVLLRRQGPARCAASPTATRQYQI